MHGIVCTSPTQLKSKAYFVDANPEEGNGHTLVMFHSNNPEFRETRLRLEKQAGLISPP